LPPRWRRSEIPLSEAGSRGGAGVRRSQDDAGGCLPHSGRDLAGGGRPADRGLDRRLAPRHLPRGSRGKDRDVVNKKRSFNIVFLVLGLLALLFIQNRVKGQQAEVIPYSEFQKQLEAKNVDEVTVTNNEVSGSLKAPLPSGKTQFSTTRVDKDIADSLD